MLKSLGKNSAHRNAWKAANDFVEAAGTGDMEGLAEGMYNVHLGPNTRNSKGTPALVNAARNGQSIITGLLLHWKADPGLADDFDRTALIEASAAGNEQIVDRLLDKGAKIDQRGYRDMTALMAATMNSHLNVMEKLLGKGAYPDLKNIIGKTALMLAASEKNSKAVEILLKAGANTFVQNEDGQTFWDLANQYFSKDEVSEFRKIHKSIEDRASNAVITNAEHAALQPVLNG